MFLQIHLAIRNVTILQSHQRVPVFSHVKTTHSSFRVVIVNHPLAECRSFCSPPLFPSHQHSGFSQHHQHRPAVGSKCFLCRVDQADFLVPHVPKPLRKNFHIPVHPGFHLIINSKYTAFFQYPQGFQKKPLLIHSVILW